MSGLSTKFCFSTFDTDHLIHGLIFLYVPFLKSPLYLDLSFLFKTHLDFSEIKISLRENCLYLFIFLLLFIILRGNIFFSLFSHFVGSLLSLYVCAISLHLLQILIFLIFAFLSLQCLNFSLIWVCFFCVFFLFCRFFPPLLFFSFLFVYCFVFAASHTLFFSMNVLHISLLCFLFFFAQKQNVLK